MIIVLNMNNTIITLMLIIFDKISAIKRLIASKINVFVYIIGLYVCILCIFIMHMYIMYKYIHIEYIS